MDAIAAERLGAVECAICTGDEGFEAEIGDGVDAMNAEADADGVLAGAEGVGTEARANLLRALAGFLLGDADEEQSELVAAKAGAVAGGDAGTGWDAARRAAGVDLGGNLLEDGGEGDEDLVSIEVAGEVVGALEVVDVHQQKGDALAGGRGLETGVGCGEGAAVADAGEVVVGGEALELHIAAFQECSLLCGLSLQQRSAGDIQNRGEDDGTGCERR